MRPTTASSGNSPESMAALRLTNCSKRFGDIEVLTSVHLTLRGSEIHGLIGQNGSGKSTLIKILAGFYEPEDGTALEVAGEAVSLPIDAALAGALGLCFVHQDLGLFEDATVVENVVLQNVDAWSFGRISWKRERRRVAQALREFGVRIDVDARVGLLAPAEKASVAIVRALLRLRDLRGGGVLVLDEPTPHLTRDGIELLFATLRRVAASGVAVLIVTHRLDEIVELTNRVTILRNGAHIGTVDTAAVSEAKLSELLLGYTLAESEAISRRVDTEQTLAISDVTGPRLNGVSISAHRGEVLGLTGPIGGGWEELAAATVGSAATAGTISLHGDAIDVTRTSSRSMLQRGLIYIPSDRLRDAAIAEASVEDNLLMPALSSYMRRGVLSRRRMRRQAGALLTEFDVRPQDPTALLGSLSGGNQQKVVLAKWLSLTPDFVVVVEPTQGVDVGARHYIYSRLRQEAARGATVIVASTEYDDLAVLCDRVLVMHDGEVSTELHGESLTGERLVSSVVNRATLSTV
jgi:ribose transport system ATP-binding protein